MSQKGKGPSRNKKEHKQQQKVFKIMIHLKSDRKFSEAGRVCGGVTEMGFGREG